jgi:hypothetical protein
MKELVDAMTDANPAKRPTIEEVIEKFDRIRRSLNAVKLRSPVRPKNDPTLFSICRHAMQLSRTLLYVIKGRPAIPVSS